MSPLVPGSSHEHSKTKCLGTLIFGVPSQNFQRNPLKSLNLCSVTKIFLQLFVVLARSRKTGQFYDEESSPADNFVKNKASKWTKTLSVNSISSIEANPEPSGRIKTFSALVKAAATNPTLVSAATSLINSPNTHSPATDHSAAQNTQDQQDTSSNCGQGNVPQITVSRDALQKIFNVRSNLKQQVNNINSDLEVLDSLLAQLLMSAATNQKSKETKTSNIDNKDLAPAPAQAAVNLPGFNSPGVNSPGVNSPGVNSPGVNSLGANSPGVNSPGVNSPGVNSPGVNSPEVNSPVPNSPVLNTREINPPRADPLVLRHKNENIQPNSATRKWKMKQEAKASFLKKRTRITSYFW